MILEKQRAAERLRKDAKEPPLTGVELVEYKQYITLGCLQFKNTEEIRGPFLYAVRQVLPYESPVATPEARAFRSWLDEDESVPLGPLGKLVKSLHSDAGRRLLAPLGGIADNLTFIEACLLRLRQQKEHAPKLEEDMVWAIQQLGKIFLKLEDKIIAERKIDGVRKELAEFLQPKVSAQQHNCTPTGTELSSTSASQLPAASNNSSHLLTKPLQRAAERLETDAEGPPLTDQQLVKLKDYIK